jgi:hypothetical protein
VDIEGALQQRPTHSVGDAGVTLHLLVAGMAGVRIDDAPELLGREPGGELSEEAVEARSSQGLEDAMAEGHGDVDLVSGQLEVHRPPRVLGLTLELAALDVDAND